MAVESFNCLKVTASSSLLASPVEIAPVTAFLLTNVDGVGLFSIYPIDVGLPSPPFT